ncbi:MAG: CAP domain-containing protein [Dehalococcoidia bacterium]|nr:CAP domain-containing protein [Dehalococcoidia bacterium]
MARRLVRDAQQLSHTLDGEPWDRAQRVGYPSSWVGEVLAAHSISGAPSADSEAARFVQQWLDSPPHRDIILATSFTEFGAGCAQGRLNNLTALYCVGMTGKP